MNELTVRKPAQSSVRVVEDSIPVLDTARFEHMQRVATAMAYSSLVPETLRCDPTKVGTPEMTWADRAAIADRVTAANCFLVVNFAVRSNMDPFAVAQCASVISGRLCYEGKLIAAMIEDKLGIALDYVWSGEGEQMSVKITGKFPDGRVREIEGTVADWKTARTGSPWVPKQYRKMLGYRGAREWCRLWAPGLILGVYSSDELDELDERRERLAGVSTVAHLEPPDPDAGKAAAAHPINQDPSWGKASAEAGKIEGIASAKNLDAASAAVDALDAKPVDAAGKVVEHDPKTGEVAKSKTPGQDAITAVLAEADAKREPITLDFPVEKPKDPLEIPAGLDASKRKGKTTEKAFNEMLWLDSLKASCVLCKDAQTLMDLQKERMMPAQIKVSPAVWESAVGVFRNRMAEIAATPPDPPPFDPENWIKTDLAGSLSSCEDLASLAVVKDKILIPEKDKLPPELWKVAAAMYRTRLAELDPDSV